MKKQNTILFLLLYPLSIIYGTIIFIRNLLFDFNLLKTHSFPLPIISVGNITVGGTGKTPHIEYLIELLKDKFEISILSRGYKRNTNDFLEVNEESSFTEVGDEPKQIKTKYSKVGVFVDNNRVNGIQQILIKKPLTQTILLDDAYQHRYVNPGISILLVDFNRPIMDDYVLPAGLLRECPSQRKRANIIIITKTPTVITPIERRMFIKKLDPFPYQQVFFSTIKYGNNLISLNFKNIKPINIDTLKGKKITILLVTGIAANQILIDYLKAYSSDMKVLSYPDHYNYTIDDIKHINENYNSISGEKIIITTEKDAIRFKESDNDIINKMYYLPITIDFLDNKQNEFNTGIINYITKTNVLNKKSDISMSL